MNLLLMEKTEFDARFKEQEDESTKGERGRIMIENKVYEPIRKKIEEWIDYDVHKPDVPYYGNEKVHDEYRRWHDRDCVMTGGDLNADTMFSLWRPLANTIIRLHDKNVIQGGKYKFIRELMKDDNMEKYLPAGQPVVKKLSLLFELGMGRENVFLLPDRKINPARNRRPYEDYMPVFLLESFGDGAFACYWQNEEDYIQWIIREHLEVFFDGDIVPGNIKDLSGAGDIQKPFAPDGIQAMEHMIDNYIGILQERRKCFTAEELKGAGTIDDMIRKGSRIQAFNDRIVNGEPEAIMQIKDVMED
ncbi:MAG: hypothetical protein HFI51_16320 [Lachnospiraceae bacterium]|nr:hypothetical protein [Lachnospiraceae bacterium]